LESPGNLVGGYITEGKAHLAVVFLAHKGELGKLPTERFLLFVSGIVPEVLVHIEPPGKCAGALEISVGMLAVDVVGRVAVGPVHIIHICYLSAPAVTIPA
jgi:hypothetical protein